MSEKTLKTISPPTQRRSRYVTLSLEDHCIRESIGIGVGIDGGNDTNMCEELKQANLQDQRDAQLMLDRMRKR